MTFRTKKTEMLINTDICNNSSELLKHYQSKASEVVADKRAIKLYKCTCQRCGRVGYGNKDTDYYFGDDIHGLVIFNRVEAGQVRDGSKCQQSFICTSADSKCNEQLRYHGKSNYNRQIIGTRKAVENMIGIELELADIPSIYGRNYLLSSHFDDTSDCTAYGGEYVSPIYISLSNLAKTLRQLPQFGLTTMSNRVGTHINCSYNEGGENLTAKYMDIIRRFKKTLTAEIKEYCINQPVAIAILYGRKPKRLSYFDPYIIETERHEAWLSTEKDNRLEFRGGKLWLSPSFSVEEAENEIKRYSLAIQCSQAICKELTLAAREYSITQDRKTLIKGGHKAFNRLVTYIRKAQITCGACNHEDNVY